MKKFKGIFILFFLLVFLQNDSSYVFANEVDDCVIANSVYEKIDIIGNKFYDKFIGCKDPSKPIESLDNEDFIKEDIANEYSIFAFRKFNYNHFNVNDLFTLNGFVVEKPHLLHEEIIPIGTTATLNNKTDIDQVISTPCFSDNVKITTTTQVNEVLSLGKLDVSGKIPNINKTFTLNFDTGTTDQKTYTDYKNIFCPSFNVRVLAHKTFGVRVFLKKLKYDGKIELDVKTVHPAEKIDTHYTDFYGDSTGLTDKIENVFSYPIAAAYHRMPYLFKSLKIECKTNSRDYNDCMKKFASNSLSSTIILKNYIGKYSFEYPMDYKIEVFDMTNGKTIKTFDIPLEDTLDVDTYNLDLEL